MEIICKKQNAEDALKYLNSSIGSKSRAYEDFSVETSKFIAKIQTHMVENIKMNFQGNYKPNFLCNSCKLHECNQSHLLYCSSLIGSNQLISYIPDYKDIFDDNDIEEQYFIANIMKQNLRKKKIY